MIKLSSQWTSVFNSHGFGYQCNFIFKFYFSSGKKGLFWASLLWWCASHCDGHRDIHTHVPIGNGTLHLSRFECEVKSSKRLVKSWEMHSVMFNCSTLRSGQGTLAVLEHFTLLTNSLWSLPHTNEQNVELRTWSLKRALQSICRSSNSHLPEIKLCTKINM